MKGAPIPLKPAWRYATLGEGGYYLLVDQNGRLLYYDYEGNHYSFALSAGDMTTVDEAYLGEGEDWDFSQYPVAEDWQRFEGIEPLGSNHYDIGGEDYLYSYDDSSLSPLPSEIYQP